MPSPFLRIELTASGDPLAGEPLPEDMRLVRALRFLTDGADIAVFPGERGVGPGPGPLRAPFTLHVRFADGTGAWIRPTGAYRRAVLIGLASFVGALVTLSLLVALIIATRQTIKPLKILAAGADRLGRDRQAVALPETGPESVRKLAAALNDMQARLAALIDQRTFIAASMAHDVRTLLTRMRMRADHLPDGPETAGLRSDLAAIGRLVDDTLSYARETQQEAAREPLDLQALAADFARAHGEAGDAVTVQAVDPVEVISDPVAVARALGNLVDNALRYAGSAEIYLERTGATATLGVRDDGPGIPDDEINRLLGPFERLDSSRSRATGGSGLGLAIVAALSERAGARFIVENRRDRTGLDARLVFIEG